ncbi:virulence associated lipoprotein [Borrelia hispanica]|uniref:virulence associated lipoprotein n=1 Tax=Borrelia hispanica TaxID=40835 RepID=UPI0004674379|nr:virulence associated lipoprotein [Borrelia hispanica]
MKRKDFILFIIFIFILISVLLVSCGPKKKYAPVASVMTRRKVDVPLKKSPFGIVPKDLTDSGVSVKSPDANPVGFPGSDPVKSPGSDPVKSPDANPVKSPDANPVKSPDANPVAVPTNDEETPEQRMQKEKQKKIGEIKSGILSVAKYLSRYDSFFNDSEAWTRREIIPAFSGFKARDPLYNSLHDLSIPRGLFFKLTYENPTGSKKYLDTYEGSRLMNKFYLALEYNDSLLIPFMYVYGKLSYAQGNNSEILKLKNSIVERLIKYAEAYYIDVYKTLKTQANRFDELSLKNVRFLKGKLDEIELAKQKLRTDIIQQFVDDVKKYEPYSIDSKHDVWPHLRDTFSDKDFKTKCDAVIALAADIKNILDNI